MLKISLYVWYSVDGDYEKYCLHAYDALQFDKTFTDVSDKYMFRSQGQKLSQSNRAVL